MIEKFKVGDRVRVVKSAITECMGLAGRIEGALPAGIFLIDLYGNGLRLAFHSSCLERIPEEFKVGDWIEFPDVGDTVSWGCIESINNGFATVTPDGGGLRTAHWNVRLAGSGVRHRAAPMFVINGFGAKGDGPKGDGVTDDTEAMKKLTYSVKRVGVQFLAEIPPGYEGACVAILKTDRILLVHPDKPVLLFDTKAGRWTELVPSVGIRI